MNNFKENLLITIILLAFAALVVYGFVNAVAEHDQDYGLNAVKPVKLYTSECGTMLGVKEHYSLCEVE